jgi:predicted O-methyltransferase YrrM
MLGIPIRYLLTHPVRTLADVAANPLEVWIKFQERYADRHQESRLPYPYESDNNWEQKLHGYLGAKWPCDYVSEFQGLWPEVMRELEAKGVQAGPASFKAWNDGDAGFVRAIWCLTRHLTPKQIVETGVAHGVTSRFILEALERSGGGHLWSIDLPPLERVWRQQIGMAVGGRYAGQWSYIKGSSRRRLPQLLSQLGQIDLFIHDSLHSERNVRFELNEAWAAVRPGGALVVDDVDVNWGFRTFTQNVSGYQSMICEAEPIRPDLRRFNKKGLFGIILKDPTAQF